MTAPKRPNYFQSQFLVVRDFEDEQKYHIESLQRHNRFMHEWGVVRDGLEVTKTGADYVISAGSAIDSVGREISLDDKSKLTAADVQAAGQDVYVTIAFNEENSSASEDKYPPPNGGENWARKVQAPLIAVTKTPATSGEVIILARITNGVVNNSVRRLASSFIARGSNLNLGDVSLDGALSFTSKTSPNPTYPQVGLDYDSTKDQLRIRARSQSASSLDITHLTIKRDTGYVGVGTESPAQKLQVAGALKLYVNPNITVTNDNIGAYFWDQAGVGPTIAGKHFEVRTGGDSVRLRINDAGNVGIGTTDQKTRLHVEGGGSDVPKTSGTAQSAGQVARLKGSTSTVLDIGSAGDKGFWLQSTNPSDLTKNFPLLLNPNGGNAGIGTTDPTTKLHVVGSGSDVPKTSGTSQSAGHVARLKGSTNAVLDIGTGGQSGFWLQSTDSTNLATNLPLLLNPNGGKVGIGTTDPTTRLHVVGGGSEVPKTSGASQSAGQVARLLGSASYGLDIGSGGNKGFWLQSTDVSNLATNYPLLLNPNGGNVGIGTTDPATRFHVEGSGSALPDMSASAPSAGHIARLRGKTSGTITNPILDIGSGGHKGFWLQATDPANQKEHYPLLLNPNAGAETADGGNVGIGTTAPISSLHIQKDNTKGLGPTLALVNGPGGPKAKVHIDLFTYWDSNRPLPSGRIICEDNGKATGDLIFQSKEDNNEKMSEQIRIVASTGEVKVKGPISCGGKIGMYSPHFKRYISARGAGTEAVTTEAEKLKYQEEFTLEMSCSRDYKENISDLTALEAMTTLQNLTPVKYDYKGDKAFRQNLGFIAEDMPDNLSSEDRKSISPFEVVPILTKVAKEQQRVIAELQETVRTLQEDIRQH